MGTACAGDLGSEVELGAMGLHPLFPKNCNPEDKGCASVSFCFDAWWAHVSVSIWSSIFWGGGVFGG